MFLENIPLAPRTTLGVGGLARFFAALTTITEVHAALVEAQQRSLPVFVLGGGSNLVVADAGWPGLVLAPQLTHQDGGIVGAGTDWNTFVDHCVAQNLAGVECLAGIPGTVGATPIQNVGAYGQEVSETIVSVTALDRQSLELRTFSKAECRFAYRQSRFNTDELGRWLIVEVTFQLQENATPALKYRDLVQHFEEAPHPTLAEVAAAVRQIRAKKGMVVDPHDPDSRSAGSFFKNPILEAPLVPDDAPRFAQPDGTVKVPAAWLIERSGLTRGETLAGGMGLSSKHILALVNQGGATSADVVEAAKRVQERVHQHWGVVLHPEPIFVGFSGSEALPEGATVISSAPPQ
ncbi:UDP-N-acetylmuramate dehydrogenase [Armatimonas rosea]|uniref:UDP-N-acetylenolpyruvoylglucosamine reductase n=1 Tax=Armatimonas rosea TaxID=685828 RepID=A0A7W9SNH2_ARMRO|nr:UDP-N-acetylmuramate dehydrogenase [Armatimonas rosea]